MISMIEALNYRSLRYIRQPLDNFHHSFHNIIDIFFCIEATKAETDRGVRKIISDSQRFKNVGRFQGG